MLKTMKRNIVQMAKSSASYQSSKINRHNRSILEKIAQREIEPRIQRILKNGALCQ